MVNMKSYIHCCLDSTFTTTTKKFKETKPFIQPQDVNTLLMEKLADIPLRCELSDSTRRKQDMCGEFGKDKILSAEAKDEGEPQFPKGTRVKRQLLSPIKILKKPNGSLRHTTSTQTTLSKDRGEEKN
ncbi:hypothetical protein ACTA71_007185 [Dictyostelium dimigraforme]